MKYILSFAVVLAGITLVGCGNPSTPTEPEETTEATKTAVSETTETTDTQENTEEVATKKEAPDYIGTAEQPVINPAGDAPQNTSHILFPDGKEILDVGKAYTIRWESEGVKLVDLQISENGRNHKTIAERLIAYNGVYEWTPSKDLLQDRNFGMFVITMIDSDTEERHDSSDEPFMIRIKNEE